MADGERCETCRFWLSDAGDTNSRGLGWCRRYPPSQPVMSRPNGPPEYHAQPLTHLDDWCGEYRPSGAEIPQ